MQQKSNASNKFMVGFSLVILVSFCYGTMPGLTQKSIHLGLETETILAGRYIIGTSLIWLYILFRKQFVKLPKKDLLLLFGIGLISVLFTTTMSESYRFLPGAVASILVLMYAVIVVIFEIILGREKPEKIRIICLTFAIIGTAAVVWTPENSVQLSLIGIALALSAALFYALFVIAMGSKKVIPIKAELAMGYVMLVPTIATILRCKVSAQPIFPTESNQWIWVILLGLGAQFIAPICFCQAVKLIGGTDASLINTVEPLIAYVIGLTFMGDKLSWNATLGGLTIFLAILFLNISKRKEMLSSPKP